MVTRQADDSQRPPPVALPAAEIDELIEKEQRDRLLVHRSVAEEMWGHEAPKAPRKWHLDRPRPPAVSPAKARAELPHPLVPSRALRDRVFDKLMTGRVDEQPHHKRRFGEHK